jgi:hypothetical protein
MESNGGGSVADGNDEASVVYARHGGDMASRLMRLGCGPLVMIGLLCNHSGGYHEAHSVISFWVTWSFVDRENGSKLLTW